MVCSIEFIMLLNALKFVTAYKMHTQCKRLRWFYISVFWCIHIIPIRKRTVSVIYLINVYKYTEKWYFTIRFRSCVHFRYSSVRFPKNYSLENPPFHYYYFFHSSFSLDSICIYTFFSSLSFLSCIGTQMQLYVGRTRKLDLYNEQ